MVLLPFKFQVYYRNFHPEFTMLRNMLLNELLGHCEKRNLVFFPDQLFPTFPKAYPHEAMVKYGISVHKPEAGFFFDGFGVMKAFPGET